MDPTFMFPSSPGTPLFPVSPERVNRQLLPQSPSVPSNLWSQNDPFTSNHSRILSTDVQGKVAQFNNLAKEDNQKRKDNEAALRRAVLGREEAENETKRFREENRILRKEIEEARARERKVGERLEGIKEELQRSKETHATSKARYEKEVRRSRKEGFKYSSENVKLQEELKSTRNNFTLVKDEVELQRRMVERREQEAFAAEFRIVGVQEELENIRLRLDTVAQERDALKTTLGKEDVAWTVTGGKRPTSEIKDITTSPSPKRGRQMARKSDIFNENVDQELIHLRRLERNLNERLDFETILWEKAQDTIHFMKMECQFKCCPCRRAEASSKEFIHDKVSAKGKERAVRNLETEPEVPRDISPNGRDDNRQNQGEQEPLINFSPAIGTIYTLPPLPQQDPLPPIYSLSLGVLATTPSHSTSPQRSYVPHLQTSAPQSPSTPELENLTLLLPQIPETAPRSVHRIPGPGQQPTRPKTAPPTHPAQQSTGPTTAPPRPQTHRVISTTRTIPLLPTTPVRPTNSAYEAAYSPNATMSRQEALDSIRERRGRARSFATPKVEAKRERRDLSAPARRG